MSEKSIITQKMQIDAFERAKRVITLTLPQIGEEGQLNTDMLEMNSGVLVEELMWLNGPEGAATNIAMATLASTMIFMMAGMLSQDPEELWRTIVANTPSKPKSKGD